jgi:type II secretory ATPase GspE/PulE/Tfp pilus assembly ATPase PilB-like protein
MKQNADNSVIEIVNKLFELAIEQCASDIHLESGKNGLRIRFRVDGMLYDHTVLPVDLMSQVVSRIKVLAHMDIAQKRVPQDGKLQLIYAGKSIDLRVSTFPTTFGQKMVLRILESSEKSVTIDTLGMDRGVLDSFTTLLKKPQGFFLVTGPTGSGKTTTLYAGLSHINSPEKNIITLEDPIEYHIEGITQGYIHPQAGFTFEKGMRALLRQDPDVVMIGEIRDAQTARIAVQAAMTGHLVLSTLHTNDAPSGVMRLMDMGIEPFLINASLTGILAQRLVRTLCRACAKERDLTEQERALCKEYEPDMVSAFDAVGCEECFHIGNKGRSGIFEMITFNDALRSLISHSPSIDAVRDQAHKNGMVSLLEDGLAKVKAGEISFTELMRVVR